MAHEKHLGLPDEFDRLLRQTMSVEPSVEFLPRVRERVATAPRRAFAPWGALLAGVVSAVVLLLALWPAPANEVEIPGPTPVVTSARDRAERNGPAALAQVVEPSAPVPSAVPAARTVRRREPRPAAGPVVIVDEGQQMAIASVMRLVSDGKLTGESFALTTTPSMDAIRDRVPAMDVAPVAVSPIAVGGVLQKGTQQN